MLWNVNIEVVQAWTAWYFFLTWAPSYPRLRTGKRARYMYQVVGNLLHTSSYQGLNITHTHTECW